MKVRPFLALSLGTALLTLATGCNGPLPTAATPKAATIEALLPDLTNNIILPTYQELDDKANALHQAALALKAAPTEANLKAAQQAWKATRTPWELSESHLLGPVKTQEIDPQLDSWPVNRTDLDKVLASNVTLDEAYIAGQQETLKGFHVIEYVLFAHPVAELTERELAYLTALTGDFKATTGKLQQAWSASGENFAKQFSQPGADSAFATPKAALAETLGALAEICEEVANGKIEAPLAAKDKTLEESQFSGNSMEDFTNNLLGVQNVYLGRKGSHQGLGLTNLVAAKDPALDTKVRQLIDQALADLRAVPGSFGEAIEQHPEALRKVQTSINAVRDILQQDVSLQLLGTVSADVT